MTSENLRAGQRNAQEAANRSQSLYRKWRSQTFGELVGQDAVTRTLKNAIIAGRVAHAYLFCGPRGTGKTSTARLLAKAVNCLDPDPQKRPCNKCEACVSIAEGRAMDLIEIDAASNRGIDEIRELRDKINFQPNQLRYKFYIIDEVHMLTEPAFNALLKTLEEPPPHAVFVLATTDPQDIPATVVSRCQRFDFQRIGLEQIAKRLEYVCQQENIDADPTALELVARQATGSLRDALSLLDQLIVFSGGSVTLEAVKTMLGVMNTEAVADFVDSLINNDMANGLEQINALVQSGTDLKRFNRELVDHLRTTMLLKANPGASELVDATTESIMHIKEQAGKMSLGEIVALLEVFSTVDYGLKVSPYAQLPLELALMKAILQKPNSVANVQPQPQPAPVRTAPVQSAPPAPPRNGASPTPIRPTLVPPLPSDDETPSEPRPAVAKITALEPKTSPAPVVAESSEDTAALIEFETVMQAWPKVLDSIGTVRKMTQALLKDAHPVSVNGNRVVLSFEFEFHWQRINQNENRLMVEEHYSRAIGSPVVIQCVFEGGNNGNNGHNSNGGSNDPGPDIAPKPKSDDRARRAAAIFGTS